MKPPKASKPAKPKTVSRQANHSPDRVAGQGIDRSRLEAGVYKFDEAHDHRHQARISQRELALVGMEWRFTHEEAWHPARLWDFTSISFGMVIPNQTHLIQVGDQIRVRLQTSQA